MDVFLVPIGSDRHVLFCESEEPPTADDQPARGVFSRIKRQFRSMLAEAERERRLAADASPTAASVRPDTWLGRRRRTVMRWVAERIAEQRLLWQLRRRETATLVHPDDLETGDAVAAMRRILQDDGERHGRWLVVQVVLFVASGIFFFIPGPNLVAYYFAFRSVGHFLSRQGARQGLDTVTWTCRPRQPLTALRAAIVLPHAERRARIAELSERLELSQLAAFIDRMVPTLR